MRESDYGLDPLASIEDGQTALFCIVSDTDMPNQMGKEKKHKYIRKEWRKPLPISKNHR